MVVGLDPGALIAHPDPGPAVQLSGAAYDGRSLGSQADGVPGKVAYRRAKRLAIGLHCGAGIADVLQLDAPLLGRHPQLLEDVACQGAQLDLGLVFGGQLPSSETGEAVHRP